MFVALLNNIIICLTRSNCLSRKCGYVIYYIYKDCFIGTYICRQCATNSIRSGVNARRRRMYTPYVCDTFEGNVGRS